MILDFKQLSVDITARMLNKQNAAMRRYNLTVPLTPEDHERLRALARAGMRKFTDQIRLLIREAYRREFEDQKKEECHESA